VQDKSATSNKETLHKERTRDLLPDACGFKGCCDAADVRHNVHTRKQQDARLEHVLRLHQPVPAAWSAAKQHSCHEEACVHTVDRKHSSDDEVEFASPSSPLQHTCKGSCSGERSCASQHFKTLEMVTMKKFIH
jgi:hypothetical protein